METIHFSKQYFFIRRHVSNLFSALAPQNGIFILKGSFAWLSLHSCIPVCLWPFRLYSESKGPLYSPSVALENTLVGFSGCSEMSESCFPETVYWLFGAFLFSVCQTCPCSPLFLPAQPPVPQSSWGHGCLCPPVCISRFMERLWQIVVLIMLSTNFWFYHLVSLFISGNLRRFKNCATENHKIL